MSRKTGHARVDRNSPRAFAICDRCGQLWQHNALRFQQKYAGRGLSTTGWLVCEPCYDIPNPTLRVFSVPPDPMPIKNPRPGYLINSETGLVEIENGPIPA